VGGTPLLTPYSGKIGILFNEETQSLSESTVMILEQHPKAIKIGSQTSGADGDISNIYLPGNLQVWFTGLGWYYPDFRQTQRVGIKPDVEVRPTINGVREGKDEVLEKALNVLNLPGGIEQRLNITPLNFSLSQNYPNPFNPTTRISYQIPVHSSVSLKVFDLLGRETAVLVNEFKQAGNYEVEFHAGHLSSGVYFYQLRAGEFSEIKKLMIQK
jgi:hypothetical protein